MTSHRIGLCAVMAVGLSLRVWNVLDNTYVVFPDETFQYFEQAHRLLFRAGVVPWEYLEGIRSWLLPGIVAIVMRLGAIFDDAPANYVLAIRLVFAAFSMTVPYVGFRLAARRSGVPCAVATGLFCDCWLDLVYYSPVILAEVITTHVALWAIWVGDPPANTGRAQTARAALAGALIGLVAVLRYQYAPAVVLAAIWQYRRDREKWPPLLAGALGALAAGGGLLDLVTWGTPFQSIWRNFEFNAIVGVAAAFGTEPWHFLPSYFLASWGPAVPLLACLAILGAVQAPAMAVAAIATVALHSLTPHKEVRFIYLAIAATTILMGLGLGRFLRMLDQRRRAQWIVACCVPLVLAAGQAVWARRYAAPPDAWYHGRSVVEAFEAAHGDPAMCGLGVRSMPFYASGGYTYLHRDVPIYFETAAISSRQVTSGFRIRLDVIVAGHSVPQYSPEQFGAHAGAYNLLFAAPNEGLPGYERTACFGGRATGDPEYCLFRRPGGCMP